MERFPRAEVVNTYINGIDSYGHLDAINRELLESIR